MCDLLQNEWRRRVTTAPFRSTATFTDAGLTLGLDTILVPIPKTVAPVMSLSNGRLAALLTVAGHGRAFSSSALQIDQALVDWQIGEKALAAIRLAFLPLPRLSDETDAYRLFLAEKALDAGVTPAELLAHLGYAEALRSLRKYPGQPRDPQGISTGGQYAGGQTGTAANVTPVFLDTRRQHELEAKELPPWLSHEPYSSSIPDGHALDMGVPSGSPLPIPIKPDSKTDGKDDKGLECPAMRNDRSHGASAAAQIEEDRIAKELNPNNPTPKQTPSDPGITSQAFYFNVPSPTGEVAIDDCLKTSVIRLVIPGLRRGDVVEVKSEGFSFVYKYPSTKGYRPFYEQIRRQDESLALEGKGRRLFVCVASVADADDLNSQNNSKFSNTKFAYCH